MLHERQREGKTEEEKADESQSRAGVATERWRRKRGPGREEKVARRQKRETPEKIFSLGCHFYS